MTEISIKWDEIKCTNPDSFDLRTISEKDSKADCFETIAREDAMREPGLQLQ